MADNNRVLLDAIIEQRKKEQASEYSDADYFELFTAENLLKQEALSYDELHWWSGNIQEQGLLRQRADRWT